MGESVEAKHVLCASLEVHGADRPGDHDRADWHLKMEGSAKAEINSAAVIAFFFFASHFKVLTCCSQSQGSMCVFMADGLESTGGRAGGQAFL